MAARKREQLEMEIAGIGRDGVHAARGTHVEQVDWSTGEVWELTTPAAGALAAGTELPPEPFGRWLLAQRGREDWIDLLADAARRDPAFPKNGSPDEVRRHLERRGCSDPDVFEQLDDAERVWASL